MKTQLEQIASLYDWEFQYGRSDFQNLETQSSKAFFLFLDPIEETLLFNEYNQVKKRTFSGRFMLLKKSDLDRVYDAQQHQEKEQGKYESYILPCKNEIQKIPTFLCSYDIELWKILEVIDIYDVNFDGVLVQFKISKDE